MKRVLTYLIGLCLAVSASAEPFFNGEDFARWFEQGKNGQYAPNAEEQAAAREKVYVFVPGYKNEGREDYMRSQINQLQTLGVPPAQIYNEPTETPKSLEYNVAKLKSRLDAIAAEHPDKQIVLIGHSRGAVVAEKFALENEQFLRDKIHSVFAIQGAFGAQMADYTLGNMAGNFLDGRLSLTDRVLMLADRVFRHHDNVRDQALKEMRTREADRLIREMQNAPASARAALHDKLFYIRSQIDPELESFVHQTAGKYLNAYFGRNDAMVTADRQKVNGLGHQLILIEGVGHDDLTRSSGTLAPEKLRQGAATAIFASAGQLRPTESMRLNGFYEKQIDVTADRCRLSARALARIRKRYLRHAIGF